MMYKKVIIAFIFVTLAFLAGCNNAPTGTTGTNITTIEELFVDFKDGNPAIMQGNGNKNYTLNIPQGGFVVIMKTQDLLNGLKNVKIASSISDTGMSIYSALGASLEENWYTYERIEHMYSSGSYVFKVEATGPYSIEVYLLPNDALEDLPISVSGSGTRLIGPYTLESNISIRVKTSDAKNAGFTVSLVDATTGIVFDYIYTNYDEETKQGINSFDEIFSINAASGKYYLFVSANGRCNWEVVIN